MKNKSSREKFNIREKLWIATVTLLIGFVVLLSLLWKTTLQIPIASNADTFVYMNSQENLLIQTWQATAKNIVGIYIPVNVAESTNLEGKLNVQLKEDIDSDEVLFQTDLNLSTNINSNGLLVNFEKQKLELGKRYYFVLTLQTERNDTVVAFNVNLNYGGLTIGEEEVTGALVAAVETEKPHNLAWIFRIFVVYGWISFGLMLFFNRRFEETIAMAFGISFIYLYIWGIFEKLEVGVVSLYGISCIAILFVPYLIKLKKRQVSDIITPGMLGFFFLFLLYFILDRNVVLGKTDELSHWQRCVRDMWYFDSYAFHEGTTVYAMRYTPGLATIEYIFSYLYGSYREGISLLACHVTGFSMLSILHTSVSWKKCHKAIPVTALVVAAPLLVYMDHYGISYVDAYLGIIGAYILICYFIEGYSNFNVLRITIASILLVMTKEMGLAIAGTIYLIVFVDLFLKNKKIKLFLKDRVMWIYFKSGVITLTFFVMWEIYVKIAGIKYGLDNSFNNILKLFANINYNSIENINTIQLASATQTIAFQEAVQQVSENPIVLEKTPFNVGKAMLQWIFFQPDFMGVSYFTLILIVCLLCVLMQIGGILKKLDISINRIIGGLMVGNILYAVFLCVCYVYLFTDKELLPAVKRYMGSYMLIFLLVIAGVIIVKSNIVDDTNKWKQSITWVVSLLILLNIRDYILYSTEEIFTPFYGTWKNYQTVGEVFNSFADKSEKVFFVQYEDSSYEPQYEYLAFTNAVQPNVVQSVSAWKPIVEETDSFGAYTVKYTSEEWGNLLANEYSYVYLMNINDYFINNYGRLFEDANGIESGNIYRICVDEGLVKLKKIAYKNLE